MTSLWSPTLIAMGGNNCPVRDDLDAYVLDVLTVLVLLKRTGSTDEL